MSWWDDIQTAALEYPCDRCGAKRWDWCHTPSGVRASYLHDVRTRPLRQLSWAAFQDGKNDVLDAFDLPTNWFSTMLDRRRKERADDESD